MKTLDRQRIVAALKDLSDRLGERGVQGEVCLFVGAAISSGSFSPKLSTLWKQCWRNWPMSSLKDVAERVHAGSALEVELGNFLDAFYRTPGESCVAERPEILKRGHSHGEITDALLAAVAEHLCRRFSLPIPAWVYEPSRYLERPYFALPAIAFRATLLLESPSEFRSRNLFVTANALSRASEYATSRN